MRLKRLELFGFKSFLDKTTVHFKPGITAIVGPNGCGKSNLIDAILWVLGEQRPKALRGDKMEDVIFNGTEERKPLGMAEVALTVDDLRDPLPSLYSHYSEVTFMRRLYRSGESEYFINQVSCRLKDIRDLLIDLKAGYRAIIEQGRIDDLLTASPIKRRELVEEAAGISKYRIRKEEALRKLQSTQQNLLRLQDVLSEVKRQINALDRQAKAAQKYKNLYEALKAHDLYISAAEWHTGQAREKTLSQEEASLREHLSKQEAYAASLDLKGSTLQLTLSQKEAGLAAGKDQMAHITGRIGKAEGRIERIHAQKKEWHEMREKIHTELAAMEIEQAVRTEALRVIEDESTRVQQERSDREERFTQANHQVAQQALAWTQKTNTIERERTEIFDMASRLAAAHNNLLHYDTRQSLLTPKIESDRSRMDERAQKGAAAKERLAQLQNDGTAVEQQWAGESVRHQEIVRALSAIEAKQKSDEEAYYKLKAAEAHQSATLSAKEGFYRAQLGPLPLVEPAQIAGAASLMADLLDVPEPYEKAIEAVLGERLQGHLIEDLDQLQAGIRKLQTLKKGRGLLILRDLPRMEREEPSLRPEADLPEGVIGSAFSLISCKAGYEAVVQRLLGDMVVVRDADTACQRMAQSFPWDMVTLGGELFYKGVVSVGEGKEDRGLLNQKRALAVLAKEVKQLQGQAAQQAVEIEKDKKEHQAIRIAREQSVQVIGEIEARRRTLQTAIHDQIVENEKISLTAQTLLQEQEDDRHEQEMLIQRSKEEHATIATLKQIQEDKERQWARGLEEQKDLDRRHQELKEQSVALQLTLTTLQEKGRHLVEKKEHAEEALKSLRANRENQTALLASIGNKWAHAEFEEKEAESEIETTRSDQERLQEEIRSALEIHAEQLAAFESLRAEARAAQSEKERQMAALHETSVKRLEVKMTQEKLQETLLTQYQTNLAQADPAGFPLPAGFDVSQKSNAITEEPSEEPRTDDRTSTPGEPLSLLDISSETFIRLRAKRDQLRASLTGVEPVHPGVIEEYKELVERHTFLKSQESDLMASMEDLKTAISKMNQMTQGLFRATFNQLNKKFAETFAFFFEGGKAELTLDDPDHLAESGVSILAAPPGKKHKNLSLLSGGEKALTGLSLLFSMFAVQTSVPSPDEAEETTLLNEGPRPVVTRASFEEMRDFASNGPAYPFCILDEVDAALDEENARRFSDALTRLSENSQFVVVTHNKQTMQKADLLYGVTAEHAGLSRLVSVNLRELEKV